MSRAWIRYLPFVFWTTIVHVAIFVYVHILLSSMLELHQHCQKVAYLSALNSTSELANAFIRPRRSVARRRGERLRVRWLRFVGYYAW
jgi:hypothetical protein